MFFSIHPVSSSPFQEGEPTNFNRVPTPFPKETRAPTRHNRNASLKSTSRSKSFSAKKKCWPGHPDVLTSTVLAGDGGKSSDGGSECGGDDNGNIMDASRQATRRPPPEGGADLPRSPSNGTFLSWRA